MHSVASGPVSVFFSVHATGLADTNHGDGSNDNSDLTLLTPGFFTVRALEGLELFGEERELLRDIHKGTGEGDHKEAVTKVAKELKATWSCSVRAAEWTIVDGVLYFQGKIYVHI